MSGLWLVLLFFGSGFAQLPPGLPRSTESADGQVLRLSPEAFPALPKNLVAELKRRGCVIPQVPLRKQPHNIIKGKFSRPGQTDWAILCSVGRISSILVFWNGSEINPARIAEMEDVGLLQDSGTGMAYSREIVPVDRAYILQHYQAYGGPKPPPIDHQGINDVFVEKGSVVLYFYQRTWLSLTGAD